MLMMVMIKTVMMLNWGCVNAYRWLFSYRISFIPKTYLLVSITDWIKGPHLISAVTEESIISFCWQIDSFYATMESSWWHLEDHVDIRKSALSSICSTVPS